MINYQKMKIISVSECVFLFIHPFVFYSSICIFIHPFLESMEEGSLDDIDSNVGEVTSPLLTSLRHSIANKLTKPKNEEVNKVTLLLYDPFNL